MTNTNVEFSRRLLAKAHEEVRKHSPDIRVREDARVYRRRGGVAPVGVPWAR
jgi:hypothetical protein